MTKNNPAPTDPSEPRFAARDVEHIPVGRQGTGPDPRLSRDRLSRYCLCCPELLFKVANPAAQNKRAKVFCEDCDRLRKNFTRSRTKAKSYLIEPDMLEALERLVTSARTLEQRIGRATIEFQGLESPPVWVDDLMLASKEVMALIYAHLVPTFRLEERNYAPESI